MKFDIYSWSEIDGKATHQAPRGRLRVMSSEPSALYISAQGHEVLAGVATSHDITINEAVTFTLDVPEGARCFVESPPAVNYRPTGEVFTNADRLPMESGSVLEVKKALRQFHLEQAALRREMHAERRELHKMRRATEPEPEPEPEPDLEPELDAPADTEADAGATE